jgi:F0F1-type ATP synthase assembly protein I
MMAEINQIETKRTIQRTNKTRSWFFEKINKIDSRLTREHRDSIQINKIRVERGRQNNEKNQPVNQPPQKLAIAVKLLRHFVRNVMLHILLGSLFSLWKRYCRTSPWNFKTILSQNKKMGNYVSRYHKTIKSCSFYFKCLKFGCQ